MSASIKRTKLTVTLRCDCLHCNAIDHFETDGDEIEDWSLPDGWVILLSARVRFRGHSSTIDEYHVVCPDHARGFLPAINKP